MSDVEEWERYWQETPSIQAVYTDKEGNPHQDIVTFWQSVVDEASVAGGTKLVDIACGNGALFKSVRLPRDVVLTGVDCAHQALQQFKRFFPEAMTLPVINNVIPTQIANHHLYLSQFGIEYIGIDAFSHVVDLMPTKSRFVALSHIHNGHIWTRYRQEQSAIAWILNNGYIQCALETVGLLFSSTFEVSHQEAFEAQHAELLKWCERVPYGGHVHLYQGVSSLIGQWQAYEKKDIETWLEGMEQQLIASERRLQHMCSIAITEAQIGELAKTLTSRVTSFSAIPFYASFATLPVAWQICFSKD